MIDKWQKRVLLSCWITYASFYLLRVNMSVAIPGIIKEFGISKTAMGSVLSAFFFVYAAGQFINGQLGDRFNAKKVIAVGLFGSAVINLIFGFTGNFLAGMMLIWGLNGIFQSMGWAPTVRIVANWFPPQQRGKAAGILGSSYQIGNVVSWALAGFVVGMFGWRWAFWAPTMIVPFLLLNWILKIRKKEGGNEKDFRVQFLAWKRDF
jgi:sugar phosphate permease